MKVKTQSKGEGNTHSSEIQGDGQWILDTLHWIKDNVLPDIEKSVAKLRADKPHLRDDEIVDHFVSNVSMWCGVRTFTLDTIAVASFVGPLIKAGTIPAQVGLNIYNNCLVIFHVAEVYKHRFVGLQQMDPILVCLAYSIGVESVKRQVVEKSWKDMVKWLLNYGTKELLKDIVKKLIGKHSLKYTIYKNALYLLPPVTGIIDYFAIKKTGLAAKYFFNDMMIDAEEATKLANLSQSVKSATVTVLNEVAHADGKYLDSEDQFVEKAQRVLEVGTEEVPLLKYSSKEAKSILCDALSDEAKLSIVQLMEQLALVDGKYHDQERKVIGKFKDSMNLTRKVPCTNCGLLHRVERERQGSVECQSCGTRFDVSP